MFLIDNDDNLSWSQYVFKYLVWSLIGAGVLAVIYFAVPAFIAVLGAYSMVLGAVAGLGLGLYLTGFFELSSDERNVSWRLGKLFLGACLVMPLLWVFGLVSGLSLTMLGMGFSSAACVALVGGIAGTSWSGMHKEAESLGGTGEKKVVPDPVPVVSDADVEALVQAQLQTRVEVETAAMGARVAELTDELKEANAQLVQARATSGTAAGLMQSDVDFPVGGLGRSTTPGSDKAASIAELRAIIADLQGENAQWQAAVESHTELEELVSGQAEALEKLERQLDEANALIHTHDQAILDIEAEYERQLGPLRSQLAVTRDELAEARIELARLGKTNDRLAAAPKSPDKRAEVAQLKASLLSAEDELVGLREELAALRKTKNSPPRPAAPVKSTPGKRTMGEDEIVADLDRASKERHAAVKQLEEAKEVVEQLLVSYLKLFFAIQGQAAAGIAEEAKACKESIFNGGKCDVLLQRADEAIETFHADAP